MPALVLTCPTVHPQVVGCSAAGAGGGVFVSGINAGLTLFNSTFSQNTGALGGAIGSLRATVSARASSFSLNTASMGAVLSATEARAYFTSCSAFRNSAPYGGVFSINASTLGSDSPLTLDGFSAQANRAETAGGVLFLSGTAGKPACFAAYRSVPSPPGSISPPPPLPAAPGLNPAAALFQCSLSGNSAGSWGDAAASPLVGLTASLSDAPVRSGDSLRNLSVSLLDGARDLPLSVVRTPLRCCFCP